MFLLYLQEGVGTQVSKWGHVPGGSVVKTSCFHCRGHRFDT